MLPVAEEYKKILIVEPAVADSITGDKWNKYIFRTGRNSSQDAASNAVALDSPDNVIAVLANDNAFGRDGVKAMKEFTKKAKIVHEEYLPVGTTDFTAGLQRVIDKLKDQPGKKYISVAWSGAPTPFPRSPIWTWTSASASSWPPAATSCRPWWPTSSSRAWRARCTTTSASRRMRPTNALVAQHYKQFKTPPDFFTAGGFSAAMAVVTALKKTNGDTSANKLIGVMEGMSFETPKGTMTFRKEDHQAMQSMYHFRIKADPAFAWGVPELVREIKARRNGHSDPQQALMFRLRAAMRRCARENVLAYVLLPLRTAAVRPGPDPCALRRSRMLETRDLQTTDLTIRFGGHVAVNAVSCRVRAGHADRHRGPQWCRQDHLFQPDLRPAQGLAQAR
jgi:hypothetical protein